MTTPVYDTFIIGHLSHDRIIYRSQEERLLGGAVLYASYAAAAGGNRVGLLTKLPAGDSALLAEFNIPREDIRYTLTARPTAIRNEFLSDDRERRLCAALSVADPFAPAELPDVSAGVYHLAGLIAGDFPGELITALAARGKVAVDVQGFLRHAEEGEMVFRDWPEKLTYLPYIDFLKTDAAEAEVMTGTADRRQAARLLHGWGAKEVMITHNTEAIVYDGASFYAEPLLPENLSGRTGRGDTCFSAYITERGRAPVADALLYAAALVSLKMGTPGPFRGRRADVEDFIHRVYRRPTR